MSNDVLVIVPVCNEEKNLPYVIDNLSKNLPKYIDVLFIDDGSLDNSLEIINKSNHKYLINEKNEGYHYTIKRGIRYAYENKYKYVITFDSDGQHDAKYIEEIVETIESNNSNIVIGSRYLYKINEKSKIKKIAIKVSNKVIKKFCNSNIKDPTSGFRCYDRLTMEMLIEEKEKNYELSFLMKLVKKGIKIEEIEIETKSRISGKSIIFENNFKKVKYAFNALFSCIKVIKEN